MCLNFRSSKTNINGKNLNISMNYAKTFTKQDLYNFKMSEKSQKSKNTIVQRVEEK